MGYIGRQPTNAILTSDDIADGSVSKDKVNLISNGTAGLTVKGDNGSNDGYLQLNCRVNSHGIKLKSPPHSAGQSYTLTFPQTAPATDKFLQTDSSGNLSFADAGGGKIGQVVNVTYSTQTGNTSSSHADSGLTASITPSATDSKIYVVAMLSCGVSRNNAEVYMNLDLVRDSTIIYTQGSQNFGGYVGGANAYQLYGIQTVSYVDSPSTTSATAYKITFANQGGGSAHVQYQNTPSTMVLMEILA